MGLLSWVKGLRASGTSIGELTEDDVVVFVVGPTGAGKSLFVSEVTKSELIRVGPNLKPCTTIVQAIRLVTTMWDHVRDPSIASRREAQLKSDFWKPLIDGGATVHQFRNTPESASNIVASLSLTGGGGELLLQEELVEQKKHLNETEAGKVIYNRLQKLLADQRRMVKDLAEQARLQNNPALARTLQEEYHRIDAQLQRTFEEIKEMKIPLSRRILLWLLGRKSRTKAVELDYPQA